MYQMARGDDGSIAVFRTMDEAKHWLNIGSVRIRNSIQWLSKSYDAPVA